MQEDKLEQHLTTKKHPKETPIILVCRTGMNSKKSGISLIKLGYLDVNIIGGGMMSWEGNGMPLAK